MRVFWFICLKVVELGGIVFIPYYLGKGLHPWICSKDCNYLLLWLDGIFSLAGSVFALVVIGAIGFLLWEAVKANWRWAKKLQGKF